jgi:hypothetical protein
MKSYHVSKQESQRQVSSKFISFMSGSRKVREDVDIDVGLVDSLPCK